MLQGTILLSPTTKFTLKTLERSLTISYLSGKSSEKAGFLVIFEMLFVKSLKALKNLTVFLQMLGLLFLKVSVNGKINSIKIFLSLLNSVDSVDTCLTRVAWVRGYVSYEGGVGAWVRG